MQTLDFIRYYSNLPSARPRNKKPALGTRTLTQIVDLSFRGRLWANSYWKSHGHAQQIQTQMVHTWYANAWFYTLLLKPALGTPKQQEMHVLQLPLTRTSRTSREPHANLTRTSREAHAKLTRTSREPHANAHNVMQQRLHKDKRSVSARPSIWDNEINEWLWESREHAHAVLQQRLHKTKRSVSARANLWDNEINGEDGKP